MTNTRRSARSKASTDASAHADPDGAIQDSFTTAEQVDDLIIDSTHQAVEPAHTKQDQRLEATDPDVIAIEDQDLVPIEQLDEAVTLPISSEIQEEEVVVSGGQQFKETEPFTSSASVSKSSPSLGQTMDVKNDAVEHKQPNEADKVEATHGETLASSEHVADQASHPSTDGLETTTTKHAKRSVDEDSNTVAEEHLDYSAGVYKSPFRHPLKAERAGKEER